ncbi:hypothetical protein PP427_gp183 [Salmonella phage KM16]|nr:hypothetical protein PP427_gp183 [Salmonella phage KM16]
MDSNHRVTGYEPVILPTEVNPHLFGGPNGIRTRDSHVTGEYFNR